MEHLIEKDENLIENWIFEQGENYKDIDIKYLYSDNDGRSYEVNNSIYKISNSEKEFVHAYSINKSPSLYTIEVKDLKIVEDGVFLIETEKLSSKGVCEIFDLLISSKKDTPETLKYLEDIEKSKKEYNKKGIDSFDIYPENIGIKKNGNYILINQSNNINVNYEPEYDFEDIKEELKSKYSIEEDEPVLRKKVPLDKIIVSENSITNTIRDISYNRISFTDEPLECLFTESGQLLLTDGYHRFTEALLSGIQEFDIFITMDERYGYLNQQYKTPDNDDIFKADLDLIFGGLENIYDSDYLVELLESYIELNNIELKEEHLLNDFLDKKTQQNEEKKPINRKIKKKTGYKP